MHHPTHITGVFGALILMLFIQVSHGGSATWDLNPSSGDWNTATNWTPTTVPNGSADTATFGLSNTTAISISAAHTTVDGITFAPGASPFTITATPNVFFNTLALDGAGITNNSGITQNFFNAMPEDVNGFDSAGIRFLNGASAGSLTAFTNPGGVVAFLNTSTAANSTINNNGSSDVVGETFFSDMSTAGNATITNSVSSGGFGATFFGGTSTAGNATITNHGGIVSGALAGTTSFFLTSTAGNATIINEGGTLSGAAGGVTMFGGTSIAGSAMLVANAGSNGGGGGTILFEAESDGGTSRVEVFGNGNLDISFMNVPHHSTRGATVGSVEGDGNVFLGGKNLTVGSSNLSTTFSGVIQDGGQNGGNDGSLTKIGTGTLTLSGTNTYTGDTNINGGVLKVDGSITSNTFVHHLGTLAGTGTVFGNVTNSNFGTVRPGDAPGTLTVNSYTQGLSSTLLIDIAGSTTGQFSVLEVLGNANLGGVLDPVLQNGFVPAIGESFTFMDYESVLGAFSTIKGLNFNNNTEHWAITYQPTFAVLTAEAGANAPDHGSTLLLLTVSLLGLVTYRHGLLRKQA